MFRFIGNTLGARRDTLSAAQGSPVFRCHLSRPTLRAAATQVDDPSNGHQTDSDGNPCTTAVLWALFQGHLFNRSLSGKHSINRLPKMSVPTRTNPLDKPDSR